jgi:hypothetical protein
LKAIRRNVARRAMSPSKRFTSLEASRESEFKMSELLTVSEVADILRVDNTTVRRSRETRNV